MCIVTFEQRRAKIKTLDDLEEQIRLARHYVARLKRKAKNQTSLADKLAVHEDVKKAEQVSKRLRLASFDIEDEILLNQSAIN